MSIFCDSDNIPPKQVTTLASVTKGMMVMDSSVLILTNALKCLTTVISTLIARIPTVASNVNVTMGFRATELIVRTSTSALTPHSTSAIS